MQDCYFLLINKTVMKMALLASITFGMLNDGDAGRGGTARTQRRSPEGSRWRTPWPWQSIACPRPTTTTTAGARRPQRPTPLMNVRCLGANRLWYFFHCRHFFLSLQSRLLYWFTLSESVVLQLSSAPLRDESCL